MNEYVGCEKRENQNKDRGSLQSVESQMQTSGIPLLKQKLELGDFMFIANNENNNNSYVLNLLIEHKRMDDLAASIKDLRYKEQKRRLINSDVTRIIYLVEGNIHMVTSHSFKANPSAIEQTLVASQVFFSFFLLFSVYFAQIRTYGNRFAFFTVNFCKKSLKKKCFALLFSRKLSAISLWCCVRN